MHTLYNTILPFFFPPPYIDLYIRLYHILQSNILFTTLSRPSNRFRLTYFQLTTGFHFPIRSVLPYWLLSHVADPSDKPRLVQLGLRSNISLYMALDAAIHNILVFLPCNIYTSPYPSTFHFFHRCKTTFHYHRSVNPASPPPRFPYRLFIT